MKPNPVVLVVEDNEDNRTLAAKILTHIGITVVIMEDGESTLEWCKTHVPDLILMDVSLPGMDGLEVTQRLRLIPAYATVPIVALTAHALNGWETKVREAGCNHYLAKPIRPRDLSSYVKSVLDAPLPGDAKA